jgi:hypothetical protein
MAMGGIKYCQPAHTDTRRFSRMDTRVVWTAVMHGCVHPRNALGA